MQFWGNHKIKKILQETFLKNFENYGKIVEIFTRITSLTYEQKGGHYFREK